MKIGITGHQKLDNPSNWNWVTKEIRNILEHQPLPIIGFTSLAKGADQVFAKQIIELEGTLNVILPFNDYESLFSTEDDLTEYINILGKANNVKILENNGSNEQAFFAAGKQIVDSVDLLLAVWDGQPAKGLGGTGDVVSYAIERGNKLMHLNPYTLKVKSL